jgi:hypothetical protein
MTCKDCKMSTSYEITQACEKASNEVELNGLDRHPRLATDAEKAYVLSMATYAEEIMGDEYSLMWSEAGTTSKFSTQRPHAIPY